MIHLAAGTYTLTTVDNATEGWNGLPSITGEIVLRGAGADVTRLERMFTSVTPCSSSSGALPEPPFRILHVAPTGGLTLAGLTLRGGCVRTVISGGLPYGGGILNHGTLMVTDSTLVDNEECCTGSGGGIWSDGTLTVLHSRLTHSGSDGTGGIDARGVTVIAHSSIVDTGSNPPSAEVGGLSNHGIMYITASTIIRNFAGAMTNVGLLTIHNSTITENRFFAGAGGILNEGGLLTILNSTIVRNTAVVASPKGDSAGIWNRPTATEPPSVGIVTLQNTILAQNSLGSLPGDSGAGPDCKGSIISLGHNLIGDPTNCTITLQASDRIGDPGLGTFTPGADMPGTGHVPLLATSQAINAGDDKVCPLTDQLGHPRVEQCDIGAIEFQPDTTAPAITVSATPDTLWPPNGKLVPVTITGSITDEDSDMGVITAAYEVTDEYGLIQRIGAITLDEADGSYAFTVSLRASRNGNDTDGRKYTITIRSFDNAGNEGLATIDVIVPHNQGQGRRHAAR